MLQGDLIDKIWLNLSTRLGVQVAICSSIDALLINARLVRVYLRVAHDDNNEQLQTYLECADAMSSLPCYKRAVTKFRKTRRQCQEGPQWRTPLISASISEDYLLEKVDFLTAAQVAPPCSSLVNWIFQVVQPFQIQPLFVGLLCWVAFLSACLALAIYLVVLALIKYNETVA